MMIVRNQVPWNSMLAVVLIAALPLAAMAQQQRQTEDPPHAARMHEYMQERMERHLDRLAARLEIRASQQDAWKAFAGAVQTLGRHHCDIVDADAALKNFGLGTGCHAGHAAHGAVIHGHSLH